MTVGMEFRISDTFIDSLAKLTGGEQKAVKTTAFDLQLNPSSNSGMQMHRIERAKDRGFWSVRVNDDIRLIVHKTDECLLLCYVDHHDPAYRWAEQRKLEVHPSTGAAQLVELRTTVREISIPRLVVEKPEQPSKRPPLSDLSDDQLLSYGVPEEWLDLVREADEDALLELVEHLPGEAAEAVLDLATGGVPSAAPAVAAGISSYEHPDAQRRFRAMADTAELERALECPWEKWIVFLHPTQRQLVEMDYSGPARVSGSAGTGKTVVALHRAVFLARSRPDARVLLTTFSDALANALQAKVARLISNEPRVRERLEVHSVDAIGYRLYEAHFGRPNLASPQVIERYVAEAAQGVRDSRFSQRFVLTEWRDVIDAWQLETWEDYKDVVRLGRRTRLSENQRALLWSVFETVKSRLRADNLVTHSEIFARLARHFEENQRSPLDYIVVDEAQDVSVAQLRFLAALGAGRRNGLFFAGDLGQRIFQQPFSWKALGVDIRGRSKTLRVNYRTSHQIRRQADRLLAPQLSDVDGNVEDRRRTVSVFNGPEPVIKVFETAKAESAAVARWLTERVSDGVSASELAVFVRSPAEVDRACAAAMEAGIHYKVLDESLAISSDCLSIATMHLAKGLEFRAVAVAACDDEIVPLQERIESAGDESDLKEVYSTERHLLYVACTRARDHLLVTGVYPASEFLDDLEV